MMLNKIKILLLEDLRSDVFLIERVLNKSGIKFTLKHVENEPDFIQSVTEFSPDVILSDFNLQGFTGLDALAQVINRPEHIPFIIVTSALDEETAVTCLKAGADDYLTKENLARLASAIESAVIQKKTLLKKQKAENAIKQLAKELQTLIQTVNTPILGIDLQGNINEWNKCIEQLTGFNKRDVFNKNFIEYFIMPVQKQSISKLITNALNDQNISNVEVSLKCKTNTKKILLNTTTRKDTTGTIKGLVLIGQDITEIADYREELEQKIAERTKELSEALIKERELNELKTRFVSMASHEFRTPLATIGFIASFLKKYKLKIDTDTYNQKLDKINGQIFHMTEMLDDVLTIGKSSAKKEFKPNKIDFNLFIQPIIEEVKIATKHTHEIKFKTSHKKINIELDTKLGRNIYTNLLNNAIKFSPGKNSILFENHIENGNLISFITDFGIGIPQKELESVFTAFHRAQNTENIQGTGLGLVIVKEAVELHNGCIKIESKEKEGTSFIVTLPLKHKKTKT